MIRTIPLLIALLFAAPAAADTIADAKSAISAQVLDPEGVQWRNLRDATGVDGSSLVCGEMLAKNYFGAYTGWKQFVWTEGELFTPRRMRELGVLRVWPRLWGRCY